MRVRENLLDNMSINYDSDKIIYVLYRAGACGWLTIRLLSLSPEVAPSNTTWLNDVTDFVFEKRFDGKTVCTCHAWYTWFEKNKHYINPLTETNITHSIAKKKIEKYSTLYFRNILNNDFLLLPMPTHRSLVLNLFPNAKMLHIKTDDVYAKYFNNRASFEKNAHFDGFLDTTNKKEIYDNQYGTWRHPYKNAGDYSHFINNNNYYEIQININGNAHLFVNNSNTTKSFCLCWANITINHLINNFFRDFFSCFTFALFATST